MALTALHPGEYGINRQGIFVLALTLMRHILNHKLRINEQRCQTGVYHLSTAIYYALQKTNKTNINILGHPDTPSVIRNVVCEAGCFQISCIFLKKNIEWKGTILGPLIGKTKGCGHEPIQPLKLTWPAYRRKEAPGGFWKLTFLIFINEYVKIFSHSSDCFRLNE